MKAPKFVQICVMPATEDEPALLYALDDQGRVWYQDYEADGGERKWWLDMTPIGGPEFE